MSKSLPAKSMLETHLKLSVKILTRFKCASKQWYSVISNPAFVALHAKLSESTNSCNLVQYKGGNFFENNFLRCNKNLVQFDEVKFPINSTQTVSTCSGLICLLFNSFHSCHFPMSPRENTRKFQVTGVLTGKTNNLDPLLQLVFVWKKEMKGSFATFAIIGFGYGHRTSDFKILLNCPR